MAEAAELSAQNNGGGVYDEVDYNDSRGRRRSLSRGASARTTSRSRSRGASTTARNNTRDRSRGASLSRGESRERLARSQSRNSRATAAATSQTRARSRSRSKSVDKRMKGFGTAAAKSNRAIKTKHPKSSSNRRVHENSLKENNEKQDHQTSLNDHCREHFNKDDKRKSKSSSTTSKSFSKSKSSKKKSKKHSRHHKPSQDYQSTDADAEYDYNDSNLQNTDGQHHNNDLQDNLGEGDPRSRSKSMPPLMKNATLFVDPAELLRCPVSPVASVDSSWRHRRMKQKHRAKVRRTSVEDTDQAPTIDEEYDNNNGGGGGKKTRVRSMSEGSSSQALVPYLTTRTTSLNNSTFGEEETSSHAGEEEGGTTVGEDTNNENELEDYGDSDNLAYNLGDSNGKICNNGKQQQQQSYSSNVGVDMPSPPFEPPFATRKTDDESTSKKSDDEEEDCHRPRRRSSMTSTLQSYSDTYNEGGTYESGSAWNGRAPLPVSSVHGSTIIDSPGTYGTKNCDKTFQSGKDPPPFMDGNDDDEGDQESGPTYDPSTLKDPSTYKTDPPVTKYRPSSPNSFIEGRSDESDFNAKEGGIGNDHAKDNNIDEDDSDNIADGESVGSLFDEAPSTTGTTEQKIKSHAPAPPLHSAVRLKRPTPKRIGGPGSVASESRRSKRESKSVSSEMKEEENINGVVVGSSNEADTDNNAEDDKKNYEELMEMDDNMTSKRNRGVREKFEEIEVATTTDEVSGITMPPALLRAPPPHANVRSRKPRTRNGVSSAHYRNEGNKEEDEYYATPGGVISQAGTLTGNEIDAHSNNEPMSEITTPAIPPPLMDMLRSYREQMKRAEHRLQKSDKQVEQQQQRPSDQNIKPSISSSGMVLPVVSEKLARPAPPQPQQQQQFQQSHGSVQSSKISPRPIFAPPPPPRRPLPPPPLRYHQHQQSHQHRMAQETISDSASSFVNQVEHSQSAVHPHRPAGTHQTMIGRPRQGEIMEPPLLSRKQSRGQMIQSNDTGQSSAMEPVTQVMTQVQLEDAAAQLLAMQSGSGLMKIGSSSRTIDSDQSPPQPSMPRSRSSSLNNRNVKMSNDEGLYMPPPPSAPQQAGVPPTNANQHSTARIVERGSCVQNMPYMDEFQDMGMYSGETNEYGQPHGRGRMRYDNGVFFEGRWANGIREGPDAAQREQLLSGFTSWRGAPPKSKKRSQGMAWVDHSGKAGRYIGDLNANEVPHGRGVMTTGDENGEAAADA